MNAAVWRPLPPALPLLLPVPGPVWGPMPMRAADDRAGPWRTPRWQGATAHARAVAMQAEQAAQRWAAMDPHAHRAALQALQRRLRREGLTTPGMADALGAVAATAQAALGLAPRRVQLMSAAVLLDNAMAEMATGEGKTLATGLAAAVGALAGVPVHVITANDYLAERDADKLQPLFGALGLRAAHLAPGLTPDARRAVYLAPIVYATAKELAFDHLRDRLAQAQAQAQGQPDGNTGAVMRGLCMAVIDEADSILLDEADVPLVLSKAQPNAARRAFLWQALALARQLVVDVHVHLDASVRNAHLSPAGEQRAAELCAGLAGPWRSARWRREALGVALTGLHVMQRDRHYLVRDGRVDLLDEVTGRVAPGRVWPRQTELFTRLALDLGYAHEFIAAEQSQRQEQGFRQQLIESVAGLFFTLDAQGRLLLWNRRFEELSQQPAARLAGQPLLHHVHAPERALVQARLNEALQTGEARVEASLVAGDGQRAPHLFVVRRITHDGQPMVVGSGIDISDRVRSEQELARYRQHLEELVALRTGELEAANARLHREDRRLRAILSLSQRASQHGEALLLQMGAAELARLTGSRLSCLVTVHDDQHTLLGHASNGPDDPWLLGTASAAGPGTRPGAETGTDAGTDANKALGAVPLWQEALHRRARVRRADPAGRALLCVPIFEDQLVRLVVCVGGKSSAYDDADERELVLIGSDLWRIVRRRRIELALEAAKLAADAASQAKSAFLANMSHEIRTPMNAIIGFAHLIKRDALSPRQREHLDKITDAGAHLLQVINDVLDFSKIEAHKIVLEHSDFDVRDSVQRSTAMLADKARARGVAVQVSAEGCPARVRGDRLRLEQILLNLVGNAVKFTHQGQVHLRVRAMPPPGGQAYWLRFEVEDSGIGIQASQMPHLFEAFEQGDASTTRRFGGTGLGLAICKRLAELMHGRIGAQSQPGQGSLFWFELPFGRAQAAPDPAPLPLASSTTLPGEPLARARVLLVEDNPINQEVACELLQSLGMAVDLADNGEVAVQQATRHPYDLVLMDVQMPVMDGLRATAALRRLPGYAQVPIIAMTANAFDDDRTQCLAAGMDDYLAKPVEPRTLQLCLSTWLRARPPAPALPDLPGPGAPADRPMPPAEVHAHAQTQALAVAMAPALAQAPQAPPDWAPSAVAAPAPGPAMAAPHQAAAPPTAPAPSTRPSGEPSPAAWRARLERVPGLVVAHGLQSVNQQASVYLRALGLFVVHHAGDAARLQALSAQGDVAGLQLLAHSLGGAAATLGATTVHALAARLEQACRQAVQAAQAAQARQAREAGTATDAGPAAPLPPVDPTDALESALNDLLQGLALALADRSPAPTGAAPVQPPPVVPDAQAAVRSLQALRPLLSSHDTAATDRLDADLPLLQAVLGPLADTLHGQVQSYSFEEASTTLAQALLQAEAACGPG